MVVWSARRLAAGLPQVLLQPPAQTPAVPTALPPLAAWVSLGSAVWVMP